MPRHKITLFGLALLLSSVIGSAGYAEEAAPLASFQAPGAHQGVAIDARHGYAIDNTGIVKYDRVTAKKIGEWQAGKKHRLTHLNAGIVRDGKLYCAHSNYPLLPMRSSVEIFDTATMEHIGRVGLGETDGSLTWVDWHAGAWWACFAHYSKRGGDPAKGHEYTRIAQFDAEWKELKSWTFPPQVLGKFAPYSCSGGAWISDDVMIVTGHDLPEVYALRLPEAGEVLEYVATLAVPFQGQAIDYDRQYDISVFGILRNEEKVVSIGVHELLGKLKN